MESNILEGAATQSFLQRTFDAFANLNVVARGGESGYSRCTAGILELRSDPLQLQVIVRGVDLYAEKYMPSRPRFSPYPHSVDRTPFLSKIRSLYF